MNMNIIRNIAIAVISNIIFDPFFPQLMKNKFKSNVEIQTIPFAQCAEHEFVEQLSTSDLIIVWLNYEEMLRDIPVGNDVVKLCQKLMNDISEYSNAHILWLLFEDYYRQSYITQGEVYNGVIDNINKEVCDKLCGNDNIIFIDLKSLIAKVGIANAYNPKSKYRWNAPYSKALVETAVKEIHKQYLIDKGITKKCLVLDCDNVLWGGILSEDGIENIKLSGSGFGRPYQDFFRFTLWLYHHGVILAICSKNDLPDVLTMFHEHSEMILREEHIACFQVNWEDKPGNIQKIAEKLNIGLDSMVFVDDSPIEIEAVKAILPEVTAILFKRDMEYEQFSCFNLKSNVSIADIDKRNETYRTNEFRKELKAKYTDYADYIAALDIKIDIHEAAPIEYDRISELTQRTNKCTNGRRYTVAGIKESIASKAVKLYSVSVSDRFSDLGLVGAIEVEGDVLTLFSLSCRALGRKVEEKMIEFISDKYQIQKIEFESTGKNGELKALLEEAFSNTYLSNCENA